MAWPPPSEIAKLTINGADYTDWETVLVKHSYNEKPPYFFRFTCSEGMPLAKNVFKLQIRPGDACTITLAGIPAFSGYVHTRQVFYDANRHHIEIQGASALEPSIASAIVREQRLTDITLEKAIRAIIEPLKLKVVVEGSGKLPTEKIELIQIPVGKTAADMVDTLIRDHAGGNDAIHLTSNANGDYVVVVGEVSGSDSVVEGVNILEARSVIVNTNVMEKPYFVGQRPGNDQVRGPQAASVPFLEGTFAAMGVPLPTVIVNEGPVWSTQRLKDRSTSQSVWTSDEYITVIATVYGWLRPSGGLWYRGQKVSVTSPMLIMNGEVLKLKSATFTQDNNGGTRTILDLRNDKALGEEPARL